MAKILPHSFFSRPADVVAQELLGSYLCVRTKSGTECLMITETEAYIGPHDLANHASKGRTKRTEVMFDRAGTIYVYLIYGMYDMFNIVTGKKGYPAAVLIRGAGPYNGPGKLTKALGITRKKNGYTLGKSHGIWIKMAEDPVPSRKIKRTPRIGVAYAKEWAHKKLRFLITEKP